MIGPQAGRLRTVVSLVLVAAGLLVGCSGQQATQSTTSQPAPAATTTTEAAGTSSPGATAPTGGTDIAVSETEYSIALPSTRLAPGTYTFVVNNSGNAPHDFSIRGPGVDTKSAQLSGGQRARVTVTLQPGSYDVWCSVGNHRQQGMQTTITVG